MTPLAAVLGRRILLSSALLALACQRDGDALFDNDHLAGSGAGSSAMSSGGMQTAGGSSNGAASANGGGSSDDAGESTGGSGEAGSTNEGGSAGKASVGGGGRGEEGGSAGKAAGGMAGHAGMKPDPIPEPVTIMISAFEDAYVVSCDDESNYGDAGTIQIDAEPCTYQGLLRPILDQIPAGALVSKATLTLECVNSGSAITASLVAGAWSESTVTWEDRPEAGASITEVACAAEGDLGPVTLDLTEVVKTWLGAESAFGLYLRTEASNGIDFASSEAEDASTRPLLSVTYVLPVK